MNLKFWITAYRINFHMEINSDTRILLANDTEFCVFRVNFRSGMDPVPIRCCYMTEILSPDWNNLPGQISLLPNLLYTD